MSKRTFGLVVLSVLVVLDLVLIALALRPPPSPEPTAMPIEPPAATPAATPAPEQADGSTPTATTEAQFPAPGPARLVAVRQDGSALAAQTGVCNESGSAGLEISSAGASRSVPLPGSVLGRLTTADDGNLELVAAAENCTAELRFTEAEEADEWTPQGNPEGTAFMFPGGETIVLEAGSVALPCEVRSFSPGGQQPVVLCADGSVQVRQGADWEPRGKFEGGLAVSHIARGTGLVGLATAPDCTGLTANRSDDGGAVWTRIGCIADADADGEPVGVGAQDTTVVVVDGTGKAYRGDINSGDFTQGG